MALTSTGFCTKCGSPRSGPSRFCTRCGAEFHDPAITAGSGEHGSLSTLFAGPAAVVEAPLIPEPAVRPEALPVEPPFQAEPASSYQRFAEPPVRDEARVAEPVPPRAPSGPPPPRPVTPHEAVPPSGQRNRRALIVAAVAMAVLASAGVYAALSSGGSGHPSASPPHHRSTAATPGASATAAAAAASPTETAPGSPTSTPSLTPPSPSPAVSAGPVQVLPAVAADPAAPQVTALLNRYFKAINTRNYAKYSSLLTAPMRAVNPPAKFATGYATTRDSAETLTSISAAGSGELAATVSFTSRQNPADSADGSACNHWLLTLYLVPRNGSYRITTAPSGYRPSYSDC